MNEPTHLYLSHLVWEGDRGEGTAGYTRYGREFRAAIAGKRDLQGSADPAFRGRPELHNPEDLFLTAVAACHMLFYLAQCARHGVRVVAYEDAAQGRLCLRPGGGGAFEEILLRPRVRVAAAEQAALAAELHAAAHELCFLANSCRVPIHHQATIDVEQGAPPWKT